MDKALSTEDRRSAGHYEVLGETYAKFEFFEQGWNPYSHFLDVDKVDLVLRRVVSGRRLYREVQVKYGRLFETDSGWQSRFFDLSSWRYRGDIFIFPVRGDLRGGLTCECSRRGASLTRVDTSTQQQASR